MDIYRVYKNRVDVKIFLEIILSLVTISFFAAFALRPTAFTITQLLEDIRAKEEVVVALDKKIADLQTAQGVFRSEGARLSLLNDALPNSPSPETFARQIEGLSTRSGATLNNLVMDNVVLIGDRSGGSSNANLSEFPTGAGEIGFSLNALGSYQSLSTLLTDLERLRRPIKIDNAIMGVAQSDTERTLTLSVTGRIPYYNIQLNP